MRVIRPSPCGIAYLSLAEIEIVRQGRSAVSASFNEEDLAAGRDALLSGWSSGSEPGLIITKAEGALVWDAEGREYIDCTSMAWSNNIGASRPEVVEAAFAQARELSHLRSNFDSVPLLRLAHAHDQGRAGRPEADRVHAARQPGGGDGDEARAGEPARPHGPVPRADRRLSRPLAGEHGARLAAHQPRVRPDIPRRAAESRSPTPTGPGGARRRRSTTASPSCATRSPAGPPGCRPR